MFDERRQRVTGIDKSYPLQPIPTKNVSNSSGGRQAKNTVIVCVQNLVCVHDNNIESDSFDSDAGRTHAILHLL